MRFDRTLIVRLMMLRFCTLFKQSRERRPSSLEMRGLTATRCGATRLRLRFQDSFLLRVSLSRSFLSEIVDDGDSLHGRERE